MVERKPQRCEGTLTIRGLNRDVAGLQGTGGLNRTWWLCIVTTVGPSRAMPSPCTDKLGWAERRKPKRQGGLDATVSS